MSLTDIDFLEVPARANDLNFWGAHLFIPGNSAGNLTHAAVLPINWVILDLEYATKWEKKNEARFLVANAIGYLREVRPNIRITVRVNSPFTNELLYEDLSKIIPARPDAVRIPTVNSAEEVHSICSFISKLENKYQIDEGSTTLHPMIESPAAIKNLRSICQVSERIKTLCLGGEDWAQNVGMIRSQKGNELHAIRSLVAATAAEFQLIAIDTVFNWLDDFEALIEDCNASRSLGFRARAVTNPRQLKIVNEVYSPTEKETLWAQQTLKGLKKFSKQKNSSFFLDKDEYYVSQNGVVLDPHAVFQAQVLLSYKKAQAG